MFFTVMFHFVSNVSCTHILVLVTSPAYTFAVLMLLSGQQELHRLLKEIFSDSLQRIL